MGTGCVYGYWCMCKIEQYGKLRKSPPLNNTSVFVVIVRGPMQQNKLGMRET